MVGRHRVRAREWQQQRGARDGGGKGRGGPRREERRERGGDRNGGWWSVGGLGYIRKVRVVESRRGAVAKESLTHLPLSWLRPPTPIPCTRPKPSLPPSLPPSPVLVSPSKEPALTVPRCLLLLAKLLACLPACLRTKSSLTLQSLYIYGIPAAPSPPTLHLLLLVLP